MDNDVIADKVEQISEKIENSIDSGTSQSTHLPNKMDKDIKNMVLSSRKARRMMVLGVLLYSAAMVAYIAHICHTGAGNSTLTTIVTCSYTLCGTVLSSYFGFSSYQDRNFIS